MFAQSLFPLPLAPSMLEQVGRSRDVSRKQRRTCTLWDVASFFSFFFRPEKEGGQPHGFTRCRDSGNSQPQVQEPSRSLFGQELGCEGQGRG